MKNIIKPGDDIPQTIGGKARNLLILSSLGISIPHFIVIPDTWFESICGPGTLGNDGIPIFNKIKFPESFINDIKSNFPGSNKFFAVRSSFRGEDSEGHSYAGQFKSKLFVTISTLEEAIIEVWSSCINSNVSTYQRELNLKDNYYLSIIIQEMLNPEISGVAFSLNPISGHRNQIVINSVFGLGEGLVSGDLIADQFLITNGQIESNIANKKFFYSFDSETGFGVTKKELVPSKKTSPSITEKQIHKVCDSIRQIKNHFCKHQDIEFAFSNNKLFILQARPVTFIGKLPDISGQYITWDNSNIIESYPGITSPLTFSYIIQLYERAYRQFVALMGVSEKEIEKNSEDFANMLGLLNGRVYYNLKSWYKMISMLPGYSFNARSMEQMMGVKERFDLEPEDRRSKFRDSLRITRMVFSIISNLFSLETQKKKFVQTFEIMEAEYKSIDPESLTPDQIMSIYKKQESLMLKIWKAPLVNDFFAMIYFGLLKKAMSGLFGETTNIHNDLLIGDKTIITTKPAELITGMVEKIYASNELFALFKQYSCDEILLTLKNSKVSSSLYQDIEDYIEQFGDRIVGELKLETKSYKQRPELFVSVLQSYILNDIKPHGQDQRSDLGIRKEVEQKIQEKLKYKPFKKLFIKHIIKRTRRLVSGRENLRLYRTKAFGWAREAFLKIGQIFCSEGILHQPEDIFMLSKNEIFSFIQGTATNYDLKSLVQLRQTQFEEFKSQPMQSERIKTYGIVYQGNSFFQEKSIDPKSDSLNGIGCCKGVVKGIVKIIKNPEDVYQVQGDILVTTTTDPGWVTIFPSISGILVERGSLLSHAAIVSREMGIPCIVGIKGLTSMLKSGDFIEMDGEKGIVNILTRAIN